MDDNTLWLRTPTAQALLDALLDIRKRHFSREPWILNISTNFAYANFNGQIISETSDFVQSVSEKISEIDSKAWICIKNMKISNQNDGRSISYASEDGVVGKITFGGQFGVSDLSSLIGSINDSLDLMSPSDLPRGVDEKASNEIKSALRIRERHVRELDAKLHQLGTLLASIAESQVEYQSRIRASLDEQYEARQHRLEAEIEQSRANAERSAAVREQAIDERERLFAEKLKQFDAQESKLVRRRKVTDVENVLRESEAFKISDSTVKKRSAVHYSMIVMLVASAVAAISLIVMYSGNVRSWQYLVGASTASITFVATMVYYIRWNDEWFRRHADIEVMARLYRSDMVRANWIAELVSELESEGDAEVPEELIRALTRNMFAPSIQVSSTEHPLDSLGEVLKNVRELRLGKDVFSVKAADGIRGKNKRRSSL